MDAGRTRTNGSRIRLGIPWGILLALAVCGSGQCVWGGPLRVLHCRGAAFRASFSPDGGLVAVAEQGSDSSKPSKVEIWSVRTSSVVHSLSYPDEVISADFSPHGHVLAAGDDAGNVVLWDTRTWQRIAALPDTAECYAVAFSPDGKLIATAADSRTIELWSVATHRPLRRLPWPGDIEWEIWSLAFSPNGRTVAAGAGEDGFVRLWDTATGRIRRTFRAHDQTVDSVAFSHNGHFLATGGLDGTTKIWDTRQWRLVRRIRARGASAVFAVAFSPDDCLLGVAYGEPNSTALLVSVVTGHHTRTCRQGKGSFSSMYGLAFSPDGRLLATTSDPPSGATAAGALFLWPVPLR